MPEAQTFPSLAEAFALGRALGAGWRLSRPESALRGSAGALLGRRPGSSVEYMDHRDYQPGDDIRRIDWAAYGRSDRLSVRLYREENAPRLDLIVDQTRSMDLPGTGKGAAAAAWVGLIMESAQAAGFTPTLWLASAEGLRKVPSAKAGAWAQVLDFSAAGNPGAALVNRGARFVAGRGAGAASLDLLWPIDPEPPWCASWRAAPPAVHRGAGVMAQRAKRSRPNLAPRACSTARPAKSGRFSWTRKVAKTYAGQIWPRTASAWGDRVPRAWRRFGGRRPRRIAFRNSIQRHSCRRVCWSRDKCPLVALPLALFALSALPALAAVYFLRSRHIRQEVSSLLLWPKEALPNGGGRKASPLPFVMVAAAGTADSDSAGLGRRRAGHRRGARGRRTVCVVLDDCISMRAHDAVGREIRRARAGAKSSCWMKWKGRPL